MFVFTDYSVIPLLCSKSLCWLMLRNRLSCYLRASCLVTRLRACCNKFCDGLVIFFNAFTPEHSISTFDPLIVYETQSDHLLYAVLLFWSIHVLLFDISIETGDFRTPVLIYRLSFRK